MASRTTWFLQHVSFFLALSIFSTASLALTPSQVFDAVKDSVFVVKAYGMEGKEIAMGSSVLLPSGKVATNCHVIKNGMSLHVGRGKQFLDATVYGGDSDKDICLLDAPGIGGKPATLGKAATLKVGDSVYAVGAPKGLELSLSDGIVSQLRGASPPFIQTTAAISPGSSGGGLFDDEGRLVGFTTLYIDGGQSLNFAMPVEWLTDITPGKPLVSKKRSQIDWLTISIALEKKEDWTALLGHSKLWVKDKVDSADAWFFIGHAHQELSQLIEAVSAYHEALRLNPNHDDAWSNLGNTYRALKRFDDAIAAQRQALRINGESSKNWYNLGITYQGIQRYDDAISAYRQVLRITPEFIDAWENLGAAYSSLNRYEEAVNACRQALRIDPERVIAWYNLGNAYDSLKRYDDAITSYRQALQIDPEFAQAWNNLALAYVVSGNTPAALHAIKMLRKFDSASAERLFNVIVPR